jgi:hypothetical protein
MCQGDECGDQQPQLAYAMGIDQHLGQPARRPASVQCLIQMWPAGGDAAGKTGRLAPRPPDARMTQYLLQAVFVPHC